MGGEQVSYCGAGEAYFGIWNTGNASQVVHGKKKKAKQSKAKNKEEHRQGDFR